MILYLKWMLEDLGVKWENTDRVEELKAAVAAL